jgi:hypothetical protein
VQQTLELFEIYKKTEASQPPVQEPKPVPKKEVANKEMKQFSTQTIPLGSESKVVECSILVPREQNEPKKSTQTQSQATP